jgi:hypothetical protein
MKSKISRRKTNYYKKKSLLCKFNQKGGDCVREGVNHPWTAYPKGVRGNYPFYQHYRDETIRLIEFMKQLQTQENIYHLNFIIGSPLEDPNISDDKGSVEYKDIQWQQIIPYHIQQLLLELIKNPRKQSLYIQIIVISPDGFIDDSYVPLFQNKSIYRGNIRKTGKLEWGIHQNKIKVNFFNCPVLSVQNTEIDRIPEEYKSTYHISSYISNDIDKECIGLFYRLLEQLCEKKLSIAINSWAVFRPTNFGYNETIIEYSMFLELLAIAKKYKLIATEWSWETFNNNIIRDLVTNVSYIYTKPTLFEKNSSIPRLIIPVPSI